MDVCHQLDNKQMEQLHALYQCESWSAGRSLEETQIAVKNSQLCFALVDGEKNLVAFARVLTDYIFKALIFDVIVDGKYRGRGLGNTLVMTIKNYSRLSQVKHFELYCLPELHDFYGKHGFTLNVSDMRLMRYDRKE